MQYFEYTFNCTDPEIGERREVFRTEEDISLVEARLRAVRLLDICGCAGKHIVLAVNRVDEATARRTSERNF
jgi:hypothetical protein